MTLPIVSSGMINQATGFCFGKCESNVVFDILMRNSCIFVKSLMFCIFGGGLCD